MDGAPDKARESIPEYAKWVRQDTGRNHTVLARVQKYIDDANNGPGRQRIRDASSIRQAKIQYATRSSGRQLKGRWLHAVPVDKWSQVRTEPLPGEQHCGQEQIEGQWTKVAYVMKDPSKCLPFHYDVESYDNCAIEMATELAQVAADGDSDQERECEQTSKVALKSVRELRASVIQKHLYWVQQCAPLL